MVLLWLSSIAGIGANLVECCTELAYLERRSEESLEPEDLSDREDQSYEGRGERCACPIGQQLYLQGDRVEIGKRPCIIAPKPRARRAVSREPAEAN
jgi:hypothetical protein